MNTPTAAKIVALLADGTARTAREIAAAIDAGYSTVGKALAVLATEGEAVKDADGRWTAVLPEPVVVEAPKPARKARAARKADLPEGYVTPVGLVHEINARGLYNGGTDGLKTQSIYQYRFAAKGTDHAFPEEMINGRLVVKLEAGLAWWTAKNERAAARKAAAAARKG